MGAQSGNRESAGMLLAMDTATQTASLAVYDWQTPGLLAEWTWLARRRQTQDLMAAAQAMMTQVGLEMGDLSALAVTTGPGSFTGVRIAVSAAKGIGLGLPHTVPAVGLPVLSVTAAPWLAPAASADAQVWAYLQAGRGQLNWCIFHAPDPLWRPGAADHHAGSAADLGAALAHAKHPVWLVGEVTAAVEQTVLELGTALAHVTLVDAVSGTRRAGNLARLAGLHLHYTQADTQANTLASLQPLYLNPL
ncbi:MAG: tRNA (adenosine(37)-N6)-threonylcarbamoyltransferase complex dimerization subunit type 1 TsaB [Litorilinea sp.]